MEVLIYERWFQVQVVKMDTFVAKIWFGNQYNKWVKNVVADQLPRMENNDVTKKEKNITEEFPDDHLIKISERPWLADMKNYKPTNIVPKDYTWQQRKHFYKEANFYL